MARLPDVQVRSCRHGKGVFVTKDIRRGEVIAVVRDGSIESRSLTKYHTPIGDGKYWGPAPESSPCSWSNFLDNGGVACENVRLIKFDISVPQATLVAVKYIHAGEELLLNYKQIMEHLYDNTV